jgi:hypothetical protein
MAVIGKLKQPNRFDCSLSTSINYAARILM